VSKYLALSSSGKMFHNIPGLQIKETKLAKDKAFQWPQQHHLAGRGYWVTDFTP
jgi:hypothetical protein